jgi:hypothetical protein
MAGRFSDGLAAVKLNGKWGYIDKDGKTVISPQFDQAVPFQNGLAQVVVRSSPPKFGYIDRTGKYIWEPTR